MSSTQGGSCLVARAASGCEPKDEKADAEAIRSLNETLKGLQLKDEQKKAPVVENGDSKSKEPRPKADVGMSPADFISLQSMRSSALAHKTNTTSKFSHDQRNLFADLLLDTGTPSKPKDDVVEKKEEDAKKPEEKEVKPAVKDADCAEAKTAGKEKVDEKKESPKKEEAKDEKELISRGPIRVGRAPMAVYHPYSDQPEFPPAMYGAAPQSQVHDPSSYTQYFNEYGYECGAQYNQYWPEDGGRRMLSASSTPDTVSSDYNYTTSSSVALGPRIEGSGGVAAATDILLSSQLTPTSILSSGPNASASELPDALSDFILKYSRRYAPSSPPLTPSASSGAAKSVDAFPAALTATRKSSSSDGSDTDNSQSPQLRRAGQPVQGNTSKASPSAGVTFNSPLNAGSVPMTSPAAPLSSGAEQIQQQNYYNGLCGNSPPPRRAKECLRAMISDEDMDEAVLWTCKCITHYPGALRFRDQDQDSLLHIVAQHMDLAKICALVEQMIKMDNNEGEEKPFDMQNSLNETPLFLVVERGHPQVVDYLLEAGANPNVQSMRLCGDTPLHYAASRGMAEIVQTLCSYSATELNKPNVKGFTPLMSAVLGNGLFDECKGGMVDTSAVIKLLLRYGADPMISNAADCGKTIFHYAVERLDVEMLETLRINLSGQQFSALARKKDSTQKTPLVAMETHRVQTSDPNEPKLRSKIRLLLTESGQGTGGDESS